MRILIAPDKFKGCLSASNVAAHLAAGVAAAIPGVQIDQCPLADGGEGTVETMLKARGGQLITRRVTGPLPEMKVDASFAMLSDGTTAVIEMAAASGLALLKSEDRNPLNTTTFGTGELIVAAVKEGAKKIILGLGGSATIDAGIGCIQACGFTVLMKDGEPTSLTEPLCGRDLPNVLMVKHGRGEVTAGIQIIGATDVINPLCGQNGAAFIFGRQKGATLETIRQIDITLQQLSQRGGALSEADAAGAGAAGGFGFGITAYMRGTLVNGFEMVADAVGLQQRVAAADLCITGEGRLDPQTAGGKTVIGVARLCKTLSKPCIAIVGSAELDMQGFADDGLTAYFSICDKPMATAEALSDAARLLQSTAYNCAKLFNA